MVPALYRLLGEVGDDGIPEWVQPTGAHDAYKHGDRVRYQGVLYESLLDANVYAPSEYPDGWRKIVEEV
jgi:hypothetical protein